MRRSRLHAPAASIAVFLLILLTTACGSSTTVDVRHDRPTGTAAPPPTSQPSTSATAGSRSSTAPPPIATTGAASVSCVQGWHAVTPGSADYESALAVLPQIAEARVVRVFTGPLPGAGTGLHVYARTDTARLLAVQMGDGPAVVFSAAAATGDWRPTDWHRTGAAPAPSASAAALLPASQAGCLDGS